jgi:hypothetical protein
MIEYLFISYIFMSFYLALYLWTGYINTSKVLKFFAFSPVTFPLTVCGLLLGLLRWIIK